MIVGALFVFSSRMQDGASFILATAAAGFVIYWVIQFGKMSGQEPKLMPKDREQRDWVYDLIKNNNEVVFVAEVPGPEDQIKVKLLSGILHVRGGQNFTKDVQIDTTDEMSISDYKYRNGVLTIRMQQA